MSRPAAGRWVLAADGVAVVLLSLLPVWAWRREGAVATPELPAFMADTDVYIFGPDAGAWAQNALALHQGRLADLDPHRLPTWTMFTAAAMELTGWDVARSGHLVNRVEHLLLGPVLYALGRALGLNVLAFAAAALVVLQPTLLASSSRFGVDPTVTLMVPLMLLTAAWAGRWWWSAPLGGALAALTMISHLTALAFPLCGLLLCAASARGAWRGLAAVLLYAGAAWGVVHLTFDVFPMLPRDFFTNALAEGVAPTSDPSIGTQAASRDAAVELVRANAGHALDEAIRFVVRPFQPIFLPWAATVGLVWAGLVGPRPFSPRPDDDTRWRWVGRGLVALVEGVAVASALAPLLAFAAAKSPTRYSENLLPIAALVVMRGAAAVVAAGAALASWWPAVAARRGWGELAVGAVLTASWVAGEWREPHQRAPMMPSMTDRNALLVGRVLAEHFEPGGGAASALREVLPYAGLRYCPNTVCPFSEGEQAYRSCVEVLRKECPGEGPIPLVVTGSLTVEQRPALRVKFEDWVGTRLEPVAEVAGSTIYAIPRTGAL